MTAVIRKGVDLSTSDPCGAPPRVASSGSLNVFVNGYGVVRVGDTYEPHSCPDSSPHIGIADGGSSSVFVNGFGVHRNGDLISCGSFGSNGSPDVLVGG